LKEGDLIVVEKALADATKPDKTNIKDDTNSKKE